MSYREKCEGLETEELLNLLRRGLVEGAEAIVLEVLAERGVSAATIERVLASEAARKEEELHQQERMADQGARLLAFAIDLAGAALVFGLLGELLKPLAIAGWWGYLLLRDAIPGGSVGKRLLKMRVVRIPGERRMTLGASFFRNLTHVFFMIDALFILGERRMRLGDMLAGTIVLRRAAAGAGIPPAACPPAQQNP